MISVERAAEIVGGFKTRHILVVGDLMLDRYLSGDVNRISPEAPVPVVLVRSDRCRPGGAANVALNVSHLGARAIVAGVVGDDEEGEALLGLLREAGICTDGVVVRRGGSTTTKTRIVADRQQLVRIDREDAPEMGDEMAETLCACLKELTAGVDGVIMEDYGKGSLSQRVVDEVRSARRDALVVGFDPKDNHELDVGGISIATPNFMEACAAVGVPYTHVDGDPASDGKLADVARQLRAKWAADFLIVTLGQGGMYLLSADGDPVVIAARAREVFDVSGAGDTVIAAGTLALATGASHCEAAELANEAAGLVVAKLGTATCRPDELLAALAKCAGSD